MERCCGRGLIGWMLPRSWGAAGPLPAGGLSEEEAQRILDAWQPVYDEPVVVKLRRLASAPNQEGEQG
jgi:hypothetical protein